MLKLNFKSRKIKFLILILISIIISSVVVIWHSHFIYRSNIKIKLDRFPSQKQWEYIKNKCRIKGMNKFKNCMFDFDKNNNLQSFNIRLINMENKKSKSYFKTLFFSKGNLETESELIENQLPQSINTEYLNDEQMIEIINRIYNNRVKIINNFTKKDLSIQSYYFIAYGNYEHISNDKYDWYLSKYNDFKRIDDDSKTTYRGILVTMFITYSNDDSLVNFFVEY